MNLADYINMVLWVVWSEKNGEKLRPPSVDSDVSGASEPGIQDINTAHRVRSAQGLLQRRIIMQPQTFAEPVDRVHHHAFSLARHRRKSSGVLDLIQKKRGETRAPTGDPKTFLVTVGGVRSIEGVASPHRAQPLASWLVGWRNVRLNYKTRLLWLAGSENGIEAVTFHFFSDFGFSR